MIEEPPIDALRDAGQSALAAGRWAQARSLFAEALTRREDPALYEGLSWAAWWEEDVEGCLLARERAYRLYREEDDTRGAARMALWLSDDHVEFRGSEAVADGWFRRAVRLLEETEPCAEHGWLRVFEAHAALRQGDLETARRLVEVASALGRRHGALDLEMFALATEGRVRIDEGQVEGGMRCLDEAAAAALSGEYDNLVPAAWTCCLLMSACEQVRDYARGAQWCAEIAEFSRRKATRFVTGVCRAHYGAILGVRGAWEEAERELLEAMECLTDRRPSWRTEAVVRLGELRRRQGKATEAVELFDQAPDHPMAQCGTAAVLLDRGEAAVARDLLERALRRMPSGASSARADVLELLVRAEALLGDTESAAARVDDLGAIARAASTQPLLAAVALCEGLVAAADDDMATASHRLEEAVDGYTDAGAPVEAARARVELAEVLSRLGQRAAAEREARRAHRDLVDAGARGQAERAMGVLQRLMPADGSADALLTPRQVEVLRLVAEGLQDREIADRLVLSEHTVHRHVANIHRRLGCSSRAAAVARAGRLGLL